MSKYEPLAQFLRLNRTTEIPMTFSDIEKIVGFPLPEKASGLRAWWSNNPSNNVMTKAWLSAGYITEQVDMSSRRLVFRRNSDKTLSKSSAAPAISAHRSVGFLDRIRSRLGGTVTIPDGADILAPAGDIWDAER